MIHSTYIKKALLNLSFAVSIVLMASCTNMQKQHDNKATSEKTNDANFDTNKEEKDAQFLVNAAETNLEEIQLGQLAQQNGTSQHVKELGRMMEDAHTQSLREVTTLARSKMITIPTSTSNNAQDRYNSLHEKSGNDFDKAYADRMVSEHKDVISAFEKASTNSTDTDIRNWATASLPGLRKHLEHSLDCQKKCESM